MTITAQLTAEEHTNWYGEDARSRHEDRDVVRQHCQETADEWGDTVELIDQDDCTLDVFEPVVRG